MLLLAPLLGICTFVLLYFIAALLYPGGSKFDKQAEGFSLLHNYWCDLFDVVAHNGHHNPARPLAIAAMLVLTVSFGMLWYLLPRLFALTSQRQKIMQGTGISAMVVVACLFTPYHEEVINIGGVLGSIALSLVFIELYKSNRKRLFLLGLLCLVLSSVNYFIYQTGLLLPMLASTQKITFLMFFIWAGLINISLYSSQFREV